MDGVNRHVVGVALDADIVGRGGNFGGDRVERGFGLGMGQGGTAVVEAGLTQGDDEAIAAEPEGDVVLGHLGGERRR